MRHTRTTLPVAITALSASALLWAATPPSIVYLGNVSLTGGSNKICVAAAAVTIDPNNPEMAGVITNNTGAPMGDLSVVVEGPSPSSAPTGGDSELEHDGQTTAAGGSPRGNGTAANIDLHANGHSLGANEASDLSINLDSVPSSGTIDVYLTPSLTGVSPDPPEHADVLTGFELSGGAPGQTSALAQPHHDRVFAIVSNEDTNGDDLKSLTGKVVFRPGEVATVSSVHLCDLTTHYELAGSSTTVTGSTFTISGFADIAPGSSCYLVVVFSEPPQQSFAVGLDATF